MDKDYLDELLVGAEHWAIEQIRSEVSSLRDERDMLVAERDMLSREVDRFVKREGYYAQGKTLKEWADNVEDECSTLS